MASSIRQGSRAGIIAAALTLLSLAFATSALAAGDRLSGDFSLRGEVTEGSGVFAGTAGDNIIRDAFFKPLCRRGACSVRANIEVNGQRQYVVLTLERGSTGYYRGRTNFRMRCGGGTSNGTFIFAARATLVQNGFVRRLRARTFTRLTGSCTGTQRAYLHGQKAS
jgi:hypothetical protein